MAPKKPRKKSAPKPQIPDSQSSKPAPRTAAPSEQHTSKTEEPLPAEQNDAASTKTWYGGTWPRSSKAAPVTQIAKESISSTAKAVAALTSTPQSSPPSQKNTRSPSLHLTKSGGSGTRTSLPDTSITKVNVTSNESRSVSSRDEAPGTLGNTSTNSAQNNDTSQPGNKFQAEDGKKADTENQVPDKSLSDKDTKLPPAPWFGWFSRQQAAETSEALKPSEPESSTALPSFKPDALGESAPNSEGTTSTGKPVDSANPPETSEPRRSWLPIWGISATDISTKSVGKQDESSAAAAKAQVKSPLGKSEPIITVLSPAKTDPLKTEVAPAKNVEDSAAPANTSNTSKSSAWVFWSRDKETDSKQAGTDAPQVGELAVSNTPSQGRPESAVVDEAKGVPNASKPGEPSIPAKSKSDTENKSIAPPALDGQSQGKSKDSGPAALSKQLQKAVPDLVLPSFRDTFKHQESPSFLQQLRQFLGYSTAPDPHISIGRAPMHPKKALAIGVHGFFPATLIRTVLGQPTGTSIKFSKMAAKAIRKWTEAKGISCQVEQVALEGEGKIADRVEMLWKLLLNWIDDIRKADFIMVACHSQGVPVAVMLVAKLILFGCSSARIGLCCMAGVNQGPFAEYKSRFISGSAGELFEFSNSNSKVSQEYAAALEVCLKYGVKILYAGAIDDQLVSLESSTFSTITHPHIYRAVFIDGRVHAPSFLSHLVGLTLKLRNLGIPDHGLIRELSSPLAGSIYTGEGHSRIYDDDAIYDLAVEYALETTSAGEVTPHFQSPKGTTTPNPYILPFAMRGLLEEEYVRKELHEETTELLKQFDDWKPSTKALKDVKFRLEGIRSKL